MSRVMKGEGKAKIVWNYDFQAHRVIEHRRPDIVVLNTIENKCQIIGIAIPNNYSITGKPIEKISNYSELKVVIVKL